MKLAILNEEEIQFQLVHLRPPLLFHIPSKYYLPRSCDDVNYAIIVPLETLFQYSFSPQLIIFV